MTRHHTISGATLMGIIVSAVIFTVLLAPVSKFHRSSYNMKKKAIHAAEIGLALAAVLYGTNCAWFGGCKVYSYLTVVALMLGGILMFFSLNYPQVLTKYNVKF